MRRKQPTFGDAASNGWGSRSRTVEEAELDITPMIDVTFLLLIFFMVTSTMEASRDLNVPAAKHGVGIDTTRGATVIIVKTPASAASPPVIELDDGREGTLDDVRELVHESLARDRTHFVIKAEGQVSHGFVQEVTRVVNSIEGTTFSIGVRDKRQE